MIGMWYNFIPQCNFSEITITTASQRFLVHTLHMHRKNFQDMPSNYQDLDTKG